MTNLLHDSQASANFGNRGRTRPRPTGEPGSRGPVTTRRVRRLIVARPIPPCRSLRVTLASLEDGIRVGDFTRIRVSRVLFRGAVRHVTAACVLHVVLDDQDASDFFVHSSPTVPFQPSCEYRYTTLAAASLATAATSALASTGLVRFSW